MNIIVISLWIVKYSLSMNNYYDMQWICILGWSHLHPPNTHNYEQSNLQYIFDHNGDPGWDFLFWTFLLASRSYKCGPAQPMCYGIHVELAAWMSVWSVPVKHKVILWMYTNNV